jgi:hypothetical protein
MSYVCWQKPWNKCMVTEYLLVAVFFVVTLLASATSFAAPNYTDQQATCIKSCRDRAQCFGTGGARDNSPRCKRCVAECSSKEKK